MSQDVFCWVVVGDVIAQTDLYRYPLCWVLMVHWLVSIITGVCSSSVASGNCMGMFSCPIGIEWFSVTSCLKASFVLWWSTGSRLPLLPLWMKQWIVKCEHTLLLKSLESFFFFSFSFENWSKVKLKTFIIKSFWSFELSIYQRVLKNSALQ